MSAGCGLGRAGMEEMAPLLSLSLSLLHMAATPAPRGSVRASPSIWVPSLPADSLLPEGLVGTGYCLGSPYEGQTPECDRLPEVVLCCLRGG